MKILDLLIEKGITTKKVASTGGGEYASPCPGCGGDDRFRVWPDKREGNGSFWCRQCGESGDTITFLMKFSGMTYPEACKAAGKELKKPARYQAPRPPDKKSKSVKTALEGRVFLDIPEGVADIKLWREKAGELVDRAHQELLSNDPVRAWLRRRGIKKKALIKFKLGLNVGKDGKDLWRPRESWGLETVFKKPGQKKRLWIPRGLVIPKMAGDQVERIRLRRKGKDAPRYYVIPGSGMKKLSIINIERAAIVVESELDAVLLDQEAGGLVSIVALGSTSNDLDNELFVCMKQTSIILLSLDFDKPGLKACQWWVDNFPQAVRWPVPKGGDPGEAFKAGVNIREWVLSGLPPGWFVGQSLLGKYKKKAHASSKATQGELDEKESGGLSSEKKDRAIYELSESSPKKSTTYATFLDTTDGILKYWNTANDSWSDVPSKVLKLAGLLKKHPVAIHVSPERVFLRHTQSWMNKNWDLSKEISNLIFMTPEVFDYICSHPERVINGRNII